MKSVSTRFLLPFGFLAALISVFVFYRTYEASRMHAQELIKQQTSLALEFNLAIRDYATRVIRPIMQENLPPHGFIPEVMSSSFISRGIFGKVQETFPGYIVRFASPEPRNPKNTANPDELGMFEFFRRNPEASRQTREIHIEGKHFLAQFAPMWIRQECLQCHGDPADAPAELVRLYGSKAGFNKKVGDLAGLDTVIVPIEAMNAPLLSEMRSQSIVLAVGLSVLFGAIFLVFRFFVTRRLVGMANHFNEIASHAESPWMVPVEVTGNDEISVVGVAFNKLVEQLRTEHASLEARVGERTEELRAVNGKLQQELTERKLVEKALRESEEKFRRITENMHDLVCEIDAEGFLRYASPSYERILGYRPQDLPGQDAFRMIHPDDQEHAISLGQGLRQNSGNHEVELRIRHADGHYLWFCWTVAILLGPAGEPAGVVASGRNITARRHAEEMLRQSEEKFSQIIQTAPISISITNPEDGLFHDVNPGLTSSTGYTYEEIVGRTSKELGLWGVPGERESMMAELLAHGEVHNREMTFRRKGGALRSGMYSARLANFGGKPCVFFAMQDITEYKRAEQEKEKLETQLFQAQKMESVGRLAGGVAHDFNNMLGVILGRVELALDRVSQSDPLHHNLNEIRKAAQRSADLTRQLLAFARKQAVNPKTLDLNETIAGMLEMLRRLIGEDIDLSWSPAGDLWKIRIDPSQIDQVLANLAVNSRDAIAGTGSISIGTENVVIDEADWPDYPEFTAGEYVLLTVRDSGEGMTSSVLEHLFEPFFTTKEMGKGTGLGLATVYGIVKQNGGFIYVKSQPGQGTEFRIYLPRYEAAGEHTASAQPSPKSQGGTEVILLVEDDQAILNLQKTILENMGFTILAANSPSQAIRIAGRHEGDIHLLITDVVMPEMNGRELVEQVRKMRPGVKCLYMSGYTADIIAGQGILETGIHFIQKPFVRSEFVAKIREVLEGTE